MTGQDRVVQTVLKSKKTLLQKTIDNLERYIKEFNALNIEISPLWSRKELLYSKILEARRAIPSLENSISKLEEKATDEELNSK